MIKTAFVESSLRVQRKRALAVALGTVLGTCAVGMGSEASAATITVDTTADEITGNGECSLREALANANGDGAGAADCAAGTGDDTIVFDASVFPPGALTASTLTLGALTVTDIGHATTIDGGGAVALDGGGYTQLISSGAGTTTYLESLTLRHGGDVHGGAIQNLAQMTLRHCTLTGNSASTRGGAIYNAGALVVEDSTLSSNTAQETNGLGGAIFTRDIGYLQMRNSTVSGNAAFAGGALFGRSANLDLRDTTIASNTAIRGNAIYLDTLGSVTIARSIIAGEPASDNCEADQTLIVDDLGANIDNGASCGFAAPASFPNTDPALRSLRNNGGPTATMMPLAGSPAIDAVDCVADFDQRGVPRPQGANCDIGAVESDTVFLGTFDS